MPKKTEKAESPLLPLGSINTDGSRGKVFIGTSGWAYPSWKPGFYPKAVPSKKFLEFYATQLNSVEVNYTFRKLPTEKMIVNWLTESNESFHFSFKAPQRITHFLRLQNCSEAVAALANSLAPVEKTGRMGLILFQLPPNFKADVRRLDAFLKDADSYGLRIAFEFRHGSWFDDEVYAILRQHRAALCVAESDDLDTPDIVTAPFTCYRFRKSDYSAARLKEVSQTLYERSADGEVYAYFKHEAEPVGAIRATGVLEGLRAHSSNDRHI